MSASRRNRSINRKSGMGECGQVLLEFALTLPLLVVLVFGLIDFSRGIYIQQVLVSLTRDSSLMAARGTLPADVVTVLTTNTNTTGTSPLDLMNRGRIIITPVINNGTDAIPVYQVAAAQYSAGTCQGCTTMNSRVGANVVGSSATLPPQPADGNSFPQPGKTVYVTEIFYAYQALTPIGTLLARVMPSQLYDVAYI